MKKALAVLSAIAITATTAYADFPFPGTGGMWPSAARDLKLFLEGANAELTQQGNAVVTLQGDVGELQDKVPIASVSSGVGPIDVLATSALAGESILNTNDDTTVFNLPPAANGMKVCVRNAQGVSKIIQINPDDADYVVLPTGARASAAGDYYAATAAGGNAICLEAYDETDWYVVSTAGTWAEES